MRSLLDRLADREAGGYRPEGTDEVAAILANLERLLNCHQGCSQAVPDYGLPALADLAHALQESVADLERVLQRTIARHEPRLDGVRVRNLPSTEDSITLRFQIEGRLRGRNAYPITLETRVDTWGRATVSR